MELTETSDLADRPTISQTGAPTVPQPDTSQLTILGRTVRHPVDHVEVFPAPANVTAVRFTNDELNSMCPVTEQPDLSHVVIEYAPDELCVESKSLKLYLWSFRDRAVFAEALAAEIAGEIMLTAKPHAVKVTLTQRPRGGIEVQAVSEINRR
ncbi:MAG: queF [Ilumatobacteraceae bacterium]|nr:queF [Ilumatobacteraceae bacterium]